MVDRSNISSTNGQNLFGPLHASHFRLFSGSKAEFYARLLEHLDETLFGPSIDAIRVKAAQGVIEEFIASQSFQQSFAEDEEESVNSHTAVYARLVECGWLVEYRDRMRKIVDFDSNARLLLQALLDIKSGRVRSFGGEVLQVKTLLDAAMREPETSAQTIHSAGSQARRFLVNLKAIGGALRRIEQDVRETRTVDAMMSSFFSSIVGETLVQDFQNLRSRNNPYRFRHDLVISAERLKSDRLTLGVLSESLVREGRASTPEDAETGIQKDLDIITHVFDLVDEHLDMIEQTNARIERRIRNTIRFLDRMGNDETGTFIDAARALGRLENTAIEELPLNLPILDTKPPIDAGSLYKKRALPRVAQPAVARRREPDPALVAYELAKEAYGERARVTPKKVRSYLDRQMGDKTTMMGSEMTIADLDDFFVFERLPEVAAQFPGQMPELKITRTPQSVINNGWITCLDFQVSREQEGMADVAPQ